MSRHWTCSKQVPRDIAAPFQVVESSWRITESETWIWRYSDIFILEPHLSCTFFSPSPPLPLRTSSEFDDRNRWLGGTTRHTLPLSIIPKKLGRHTSLKDLPQWPSQQEILSPPCPFFTGILYSLKSSYPPWKANLFAKVFGTVWLQQLRWIAGFPCSRSRTIEQHLNHFLLQSSNSVL